MIGAEARFRGHRAHMRVLQVLHQGLGGIQTYVDTVVRHLVNRGTDVYCFSEPDFLRAPGFPAVRKVLTRPFEPLTGENVSVLVRCCSEFIRAEGIDVVHVHGWRGGLIGGLAALSAGTPYVFGLHGRADPAVLIRCYGVSVLSVLARCVLRHAGLVIAISEGSLDSYLESFDGLRSRARLLRNPVDFQGFDIPPNRRLSPLTAVLVSRLDKGKEASVRSAFELFAALKGQASDWEFLVLGDGPRRPMIERDAARLGLPVQFLGWRHDVAQVLQKAHVVVGMGRCALEGLASRRLVVVSGWRGETALVTPGMFPAAQRHTFNGQACTPESPHRLARTINDILRGGNFPYEELRALAARDHDARLVAQQLDAWYQEVATKPLAAGAQGDAQGILAWFESIGPQHLGEVAWESEIHRLPAALVGCPVERAVLQELLKRAGEKSCVGSRLLRKIRQFLGMVRSRAGKALSRPSPSGILNHGGW